MRHLVLRLAGVFATALLLLLAGVVFTTPAAEARRGAGGAGRAPAGGRAAYGGNTRTSVNRNVNQNVNVNRDVNVDVDHHHGRGYGYGYGGYHPVARTAAVVGTAAVIGSMVYSLPPSCETVSANGVTYQHCGNSWYQPQYSGSQVTYVVVGSPQ